MNIRLLCPECLGILTDKFGSGECSITLGGAWSMDVECLKCGKHFFVEVVADPQELQTHLGGCPVRGFTVFHRHGCRHHE